MMHSQDLTPDVTVHYNGDYSGEVIISHANMGDVMAVPFDALRVFVLGSFRDAEISHLEQLDADALVQRYAPRAVAESP